MEETDYLGRPILGEFEVMVTWREMGRTRHRVRCRCGGEVTAYAWSWAGNGKKRCPHCRGWLIYGTGNVVGERR